MKNKKNIRLMIIFQISSSLINNIEIQIRIFIITILKEVPHKLEAFKKDFKELSCIETNTIPLEKGIISSSKKRIIQRFFIEMILSQVEKG